MEHVCDKCQKEELSYVDTVMVGNKTFCKSCYSDLKGSEELVKVRQEAGHHND